MARLASVAKGGYYPTPPSVMNIIQNMIDIPDYGGRVLDPAAGTAEAARILASDLNLEMYVNELNNDRGKIAKHTADQLASRVDMPLRDKGVTRGVVGDIKNMNCTNKSMTLLFLNPPYDWDDFDGRLEYQFLKYGNHCLQENGLLVYIIPQKVLGHRNVRTYLASWFNNITIRRFPGEEFDAFKQIVVFGYKNHRLKTADKGLLERFTKLSNDNPELLSELSDDETIRLKLPKPIRKDVVFRGLFLNEDDLQREVDMLGVSTTNDYLTHFTDDGGGSSAMRPLTPLKLGHLAGLIAAGFLNNTVLSDEVSGERLLIRGRSRKLTHSVVTKQDRDDGSSKKTTTQTEYAITEIVTVNNQGQIREIKPQELPDFLHQWLDQLAAAVNKSYDPIYKFDMGKYKDLIGNRGTMYPPQKHVVAAVATRLAKYRDSIIVGEMGTGKTRMAAGVIAAIEADRSIIACPPHLYKKWIREAQMVLPEAQFTFLNSTSDIRKWMERDAKKRKQVGVMKFTSMRAASGWIPSYTYWEYFTPAEKSLIYADRHARNEGLDPPYIPTETRIKMRLFSPYLNMMSERGVRNPDTGQTAINSNEFMISKETFDTSKNQVQKWASVETPKPELSKERKWFAPMYQYKRYGDFEQSMTFNEFSLRARKLSYMARNHGPDYRPRRQTIKPRKKAKYPLSEYIKRHYKGQIDLVIFDEVHKLKGHDSDQGYAFHNLAQASKKVLTLTGTIYGGKASTLFYILYRTAPDMAFEFTDRNEKGRKRMKMAEWIRRYGMLEYWNTEHTPSASSQTGNKRVSSGSKEAPGSSPEMLPWLLSRSVFISLSDLGFELPDYEEIPMPIIPTEDMVRSLKDLDSQLGAEMRLRIAKGDRSLLSSYLMANLMWPDSPWRDEITIDPKTKKNPIPKVISHVPALPKGELYPKEEAILDLIKDKVFNKGERVLLLCQQTRIRNITDYWSDILTQAGLKPSIINCDAGRREEWINKQVELGINVLITHPEKVETGLDLLDFPTIVWMGIDYSVYRVMQASRRSWRIGQTKPVQVYFFYYEESMQETAIGLIAKKMAASTRVNGDVIEQASLADLSGSNNIEDALMKMILNGDEKPQNLAKDFFKQANKATEDATSFIGGYEIPEEEEAPEEIIVTHPGEHKASVIVTKLHGEGQVSQKDLEQSVVVPLEPTKLPSESGQMRLVFGATLEKPVSRKRKKSKAKPGQGKQMSLFSALRERRETYNV